jgi:hypothetical protein
LDAVHRAAATQQTGCGGQSFSGKVSSRDHGFGFFCLISTPILKKSVNLNFLNDQVKRLQTMASLWCVARKHLAAMSETSILAL